MVEAARSRWVRLVITAAVVGWVLLRIELSDAVAHLAGARWWVFVLPGLLQVLSAGVAGLRVKLLMQACGLQVSARMVTGEFLKAGFIGLVLPTGGSEIAKVAGLTRRTGRGDAALAALAVSRLLELIVWTGLLLLGLHRGLLQQDPLLGGAAVLFSLAFPSVVILAAAGAGWGPGVARRLPGRLGDFAARSAEALLQVRARPDLVLVALALAAPSALINCATIWVILHGHGIAMPYIDVLAIFPAADTIISLPITISGVGVREAVYAHTLAPWGATEAHGAAAGLTRWMAELARAAVGGVLFVIDHSTTAKR